MQLLVDLWGNETTEIIYFFNYSFFFSFKDIFTCITSAEQPPVSEQHKSLVKRWKEAPGWGEEESRGASGASISSCYPEVLCSGATMATHNPADPAALPSQLHPDVPAAGTGGHLQLSCFKDASLLCVSGFTAMPS